MSEESEVRLPEVARLEEMAKLLRKQAAALHALSRTVRAGSPKPMARAVEKLEAEPGVVVPPILEEVRAWLVQEKAGRRRRLAQGLRAACAAWNLDLLVLCQDPLEIRIPPVSIRIDTERDSAEVVFADQVLRRSEARAEAILEARERAVKDLEGRDWDPRAWLTHLHAAWWEARTGAADWVEINEVLPGLAWRLQPRRFRKDPSARNFLSYPRSRLAYDLWRVRRDRTLSVDGWRLSLGPATGGSTKDKSRVLRLEDDRGQGQYHLTLRFVRDAEPPPGPEASHAEP